VSSVKTYENSTNVLSRAASRIGSFQRDPTDDERTTFDSEVTYLPWRFLQRHALLKSLIATHIFGRNDTGIAEVDGFSDWSILTP
jgi:hypothetical protein